jgi:hypothetical protein
VHVDDCRRGDEASRRESVWLSGSGTIS